MTGIPDPSIELTDEALWDLRSSKWAIDELRARLSVIVYNFANRTHIPGAPLEDRIQDAMLAMERAIQTWDPMGGASVRTYCNRVVSREMVNIWRRTCDRGRIHPDLVVGLETTTEDGEVVSLVDTFADSRRSDQEVDLVEWWLPAFEDFVFDAAYEIASREPKACCDLLLDIAPPETRAMIRKSLRSEDKAQYSMFEPAWVEGYINQFDLLGRALWRLLGLVAAGDSIKDIAQLHRVSPKLVRRLLALVKKVAA